MLGTVDAPANLRSQPHSWNSPVRYLTMTILATNALLILVEAPLGKPQL